MISDTENTDENESREKNKKNTFEKGLKAGRGKGVGWRPIRAINP